MYDVAVVGAGPAGSATAIHLARAGLDVALLDRARFPRNKACGEGLFPGGVAELRDLVPGFASGRELESIRFRGFGRAVDAPLGSPGRRGLGVERLALDPVLVRAATTAGATLIEDCRVDNLARPTTLATSRGPIEARVIVGADGLNSRMRRLAGLDYPKLEGGRYGVVAHVAPKETLGPVIDVFIGERSEIYLTPISDSIANLGVLTGRAGMRPFAGNIAAAFSETVGRHPALAPGFTLLEEPLAAGPFPVRARKAWRGNLVLAGDAAGFFDGISGEGMSAALRGARLCAGAVAAYLASANEDAFARYDRARRRLVRPSNLVASLALFLAQRPRVARVAIRNMERRPGTLARFVAVNCGEKPLSHLRPRDALALVTGL